MRRLLRFLVTILLLPFIVGYVQSFYAGLVTINRLRHQHYYFIFGFLLYLLVQVCLFKPYILGSCGTSSHQDGKKTESNWQACCHEDNQAAEYNQKDQIPFQKNHLYGFGSWG